MLYSENTVQGFLKDGKYNLWFCTNIYFKNLLFSRVCRTYLTATSHIMYAVKVLDSNKLSQASNFCYVI